MKRFNFVLDNDLKKEGAKPGDPKCLVIDAPEHMSHSEAWKEWLAGRLDGTVEYL